MIDSQEGRIMRMMPIGRDYYQLRSAAIRGAFFAVVIAAVAMLVIAAVAVFSVLVIYPTFGDVAALMVFTVVLMAGTFATIAALVRSLVRSAGV
jgi:hypothetical protein